VEVRIVIMGVAGCGKSEIGQRVAERLAVPLIEGDAFHPPESVAKMRDGVPLTDADRAGWLDLLGKKLASSDGAVLTCSALRRVYRDKLRQALLLQAAPLPLPTPARLSMPLLFLFLNVDEPTAQARVAARASHFYPASLVASQFATLEDPMGEPQVLTVDATLQPEKITEHAVEWINEIRHEIQREYDLKVMGALHAKH
jgi:gluconokinase